MSTFANLFLIAGLGLGLAGCSHAGQVSRVATDFNRAMAQTRNEQTLLNIVRASAREPLQFTSIGEVTATVNRTVGIDTVATNLITGGRDAISPTLRLNASTVPVLRMAPLANKDFVEGLLKPTTPETLSNFIGQGWDADFLLPLLVGSYQCGATPVVNSGEPGEGDDVRRRLSAAAAGFNLRQQSISGAELSMTVTSDKALSTLGSGLAHGYRVEKVEPTKKAGRYVLTLRGPGRSGWVADTESLCGRSAAQASAFSFTREGASSIQLRSPEGIIYFLGQALRPCYLAGASSCEITYLKDDQLRYLFRVFAGDRPAGGSAIMVEMYGRSYWIPRLDPQDRDRTLKTLTFLTELIALQTNPVPLSPSLISIPQ